MSTFLLIKSSMFGGLFSILSVLISIFWEDNISSKTALSLSSSPRYIFFPIKSFKECILLFLRLKNSKGEDSNKADNK